MTFINMILFSRKEARDIDASQPQERMVWTMSLSLSKWSRRDIFSAFCPSIVLW